MTPELELALALSIKRGENEKISDFGTLDEPDEEEKNESTDHCHHIRPDNSIGSETQRTKEEEHPC